MSVAPRNLEKKTLTLKRGSDGKLLLPISELSKISVRMPAGLPAGYRVVFMQDAASNTTVGVTKDDVEVTPLEDLTRLQQIPRIVRKCEDDVGRAAKNLTAQRLLYDNVDEKTKEGVNPSQEFEVAAIDAFTASQNLEENYEVLTRHESKVAEEILARNYLLEETARISQVAKEWLKAHANGAPAPKTLVSALKESGIPNWVYSRLLKPLPENTRNWFRFLFPKDPAKGIRMNLAEYAATAGNHSGAVLFSGSRTIFDLVDRLGEEKSAKADKSASYLLLPQFTALEELAQVRVKFPNITCISKKLQVVLNMLYSMSRAILPLDKEARDKLIGLLFEKPDYEEDNILSPMQQLAKAADQKFLFWNLGKKELLLALELYNCPKQLLDKITEDEVGELRPSSFEPPKLEGKLQPIKPLASPEDPNFKKFLETLESRGFLQRKKRDKKRVPLYTFVPHGPTKALLETVKSHKPFIPIVDDVERFLIQFKNSRIREAAAVQLHAALLGLVGGKKPRIGISGLNPDREDEEGSISDGEDDAVPVDAD